MAHIVCRKGRYYSLEESYRENGKVRKRILKYYGTRKPSDPQARMEQMLDTAERKAEEWDDYQRKEFGETASERRAREDEEAKFSHRTFLEETTTSKHAQSPAERQSPAHSGESEAPSMSSETSDSQANAQSSEPDAPAGSDDASGS